MTGGTKGSEAARKKSVRLSLMEEKGGKGGAGGAESDVAGCSRECWSLHEEQRQSVGAWDERQQQKCTHHCRQLQAILPLFRMCNQLLIFECKFFVSSCLCDFLCKNFHSCRWLFQFFRAHEVAHVDHCMLLIISTLE